MSIELSEQQRKAVIAGQAVRVPAPELGQDVVLLNARAFHHMQELLDDEKEQAAFRKFAGKQASRLAHENPY